MTNQVKILENMKFLGLKPVEINNTEKRSAVRKLLNGLGFATADYIELTRPQLQDIYNGLLTSVGSPLSMVKNMTDTMCRQAMYEFGQAMKASDEPFVVIPLIKNPKKSPYVEESTDMSMSETQALQALKKLLGGKQEMDVDAVQAMIDKAMASIQAPLPTEIKIISSGGAVVMPVGLHHNLLPTLIKALSTGCNIMLVGPAGSGKTTLAHQAAEALGLQFYFNSAIASEYKLTGFIDAQGRVVSTAFRKAYEFGGLYLFDEIDASMPDALLAFNAALANGYMDFPNGTVKRHEKFYCVAAANTYGKGADRVYVGRNQLDAASLDRFIVFNVEYDEKLERALAGNDNWTDKIQGIRKAVHEHKIRHVVSPRASINGARMIAAGFKESEVLDSVVWKGLDADSVKKIKASC